MQERPAFETAHVGESLENLVDLGQDLDLDCEVRLAWCSGVVDVWYLRTRTDPILDP